MGACSSKPAEAAPHDVHLVDEPRAPSRRTTFASSNQLISGVELGGTPSELQPNDSTSGQETAGGGGAGGNGHDVQRQIEEATRELLAQVQRAQQEADKANQRARVAEAKVDALAQSSEAVAHIKVADSGIFLVIDAIEGADAQTKWARLCELVKTWANMNMLPGVDLDECSILPMCAPAAWGEDVGPHFSIVSLPGRGTFDCDSKPDPYQEVTGSSGRKTRVLTEEMRDKAAALVGKEYRMDLSRPQVSFLLGHEGNDDQTNGPERSDNIWSAVVRAHMLLAMVLRI